MELKNNNKHTRQNSHKYRHTVIEPDEPTYFGIGRSDVLDILFKKKLKQTYKLYTASELSSDHYPVFFLLND